MAAGRPALADAGTLYAFAHQLYWDFRRLDEGRQRQWFDQHAYQQLMQAAAHANVKPTRRQHRRLREVLKDDLQHGRVNPEKTKEWLTSARISQRAVNRAWLHYRVAEAATSTKKIPGEPDVIDALLTAQTPEAVREICSDAYANTGLKDESGVIRDAEVPNWPLPYGSVLPLYLSQHAEAFIAAKSDRRYPKSGRSSSRLKRLWFLSRALAGAIFNVSARTAINLVGSTRPEEAFEESRAAKPARRKRSGEPNNKP
jgi:hypothetical protein